MARSYGTGFRARSGEARDFGAPVITGGAQSDLGAAAGTVNMGNAYASLRKTAPKFDEISATSMAARASERSTHMQTQAQIDATQIAADASVKSAKLQAKAAKDAASDQAKGSMMGSAFGAIGSIGGALIGLSDATTKTDIKPIRYRL